MVLRASSHARYDVKYHFVWCPKYRRLALKGNIGKYVRRVIYEVAERYDIEVLEMAVMPDHVHLFLSAAPDDSPAALIQKIKSITCPGDIPSIPKPQANTVGRSAVGARLLRDDLRHGHHRRNDTPIYQRATRP